MNIRWQAAPPSYDALTLPLLEAASDGQVTTLAQCAPLVVARLGLDSGTGERLAAGPSFLERLRWAKTYLTQAGLLRRVGWGKFVITPQGLEVLRDPPAVINRRYLMRFPVFREAQSRSTLPASERLEQLAAETMTPQDVMELAHLSLQQDLAADLMRAVLAASPGFFERLVIDLLLAMGYGGSRQDAAQALGQTGDGGLDGLIREDALGLDVIYVQAKRWHPDHAVGRPDLQAFVGSLIGAGGKKGVFITTSRFTKGAVSYANSVTETRVILIDGARLAALMMQHGVGVTVERVYRVQTLDADYFDGPSDDNTP